MVQFFQTIYKKKTDYICKIYYKYMYQKCVIYKKKKVKMK